MIYKPRFLSLNSLLEKKSHFLLGPRQTGKTSLIRNTLPDAKIYNLLDHETYQKLLRQPGRLTEELREQSGFVVIDEIQKLPLLLDQVQMLIEERPLHFLLTGSSARKLRRGGVNLLGGRAREIHLHAFTRHELGDDFELLRALNFGLLPSVYFSSEPIADLKAYAGAYLREEIAAEGLTRNIPAFSRFLEVAAICNGQMINYQAISLDCQVPRTTVQEYYSILKDTLIAEEIEPWKRAKKRKTVSKSKYYFFDIGVINILQNSGEIQPRSKLFGDAFEAYIFHELAAYRDYCGGGGTLNFWRSENGEEVDFILNDEIAIEVKGKENVDDRDLRGLRALQSEEVAKRLVLVCLETRKRVVDGIEIVPWTEFLDELWKN